MVRSKVRRKPYHQHQSVCCFIGVVIITEVLTSRVSECVIVALCLTRLSSLSPDLSSGFCSEKLWLLRNGSLIILSAVFLASVKQSLLSAELKSSCVFLCLVAALCVCVLHCLTFYSFNSIHLFHVMFYFCCLC